jgi:hypothetical protein
MMVVIGFAALLDHSWAIAIACFGIAAFQAVMK